MTKVQFMRFRRRDRRHRWYRRLFIPVCLIGPLFIVAILTALDPSTSFARDNMWRRMASICMEYNAELRHLSSDTKFAVIAIPDALTNNTDTGCYQAAQLFHRICSLGGPELELTVYRINPEYVFIGNPADDRDAGELFEERHPGIPSERNPMTLAWTRELVNGDPWE